MNNHTFDNQYDAYRLMKMHYRDLNNGDLIGGCRGISLPWRSRNKPLDMGADFAEAKNQISNKIMSIYGGEYRTDRDPNETEFYKKILEYIISRFYNDGSASTNFFSTHRNLGLINILAEQIKSNQNSQELAKQILAFVNSDNIKDANIFNDNFISSSDQAWRSIFGQDKLSPFNIFFICLKNLCAQLYPEFNAEFELLVAQFKDYLKKNVNLQQVDENIVVKNFIEFFVTYQENVNTTNTNNQIGYIYTRLNKRDDQDPLSGIIGEMHRIAKQILDPKCAAIPALKIISYNLLVLLDDYVGRKNRFREDLILHLFRSKIYGENQMNVAEFLNDYMKRLLERSGCNPQSTRV